MKNNQSYSSQNFTYCSSVQHYGKDVFLGFDVSSAAWNTDFDRVGVAAVDELEEWSFPKFVDDVIESDPASAKQNKIQKLFCLE